MNTQTAINQLGQMHIRTSQKAMWSNGKNMIGGSFKVSKSLRTEEEGLTSLPSSSSPSSRRSVSERNNPSTHTAAENHVISEDTKERIRKYFKDKNTPLSSILEDLGVDYLDY